MKAMNSWIVAVVTCSAFAGQANADVHMVGVYDGFPGVNAVRGPQSIDGVEGAAAAAAAAAETQLSSSREQPLFVPGSLINKTSTGVWLLAQSVRQETATQRPKVEMNQLASRGPVITPIPPVGTEVRPISTFAYFVQAFKSHNESSVAQSTVYHDEVIFPRTSNMTLIGLLTVILIGLSALISVSRQRMFGLNAYRLRSSKS